MKTREIIERADQNLFHVYRRFPVVFDHGEGVYLYDTEGKGYLDFASGIGVMAFGYGDPDYTAALKDQAEKLLHTSNLYYHAPMAASAEAAVRVSGMDRVFFTNSGAEAIEGALKTAKKYACRRDGHAGHEIIAMRHSFHGRTVGAVSVTGNDHYRDPFYPLMDGVRFSDFNDISGVEAALTEKTCAILLEPVQGEGGIYPADPAFLQAVRALCDERDILLIFDEIQCGMGRTGSYFAYQQYGVRPDILTSAKALGGGVPVGAFFVTERVAEASLIPGDHGTTYGGNPLVCSAVAKTIELMEKRDLPGHVKTLTPYLEDALEEIREAYPIFTERRGMGFMQGLVLEETKAPGEIVSTALLEENLILLSAGTHVIRLLPPLVIEKEDIDEMKRRLCRALDRVL